MALLPNISLSSSSDFPSPSPFPSPPCADLATLRGTADGMQRKFAEDSCELEDLLSKLNPLAEEFIPSSPHQTSPEIDQRRTGFNLQRSHSADLRTSMDDLCEDSICRTVYVSDIDHQVTEELLAALFITRGQVVDCRICGDPKSVLRFAFVEFTDDESAKAALSLTGTVLGYYPVRVFPSKTAIVPVDPNLLPRVSQADVQFFFEVLCGKVARLRLLGDYYHSTRIAFVEFVLAGSAIAALNCSGVILGSSPIRVSPSKTPVRVRASRNSF